MRFFTCTYIWVHRFSCIMLHPSRNSSAKFCHTANQNSWLRQFSALSSERFCDNTSGPCKVWRPYVPRTLLPSFKWFLNLRNNPRTFSNHWPGTSVQFEGHHNTEVESYSPHKPHLAEYEEPDFTLQALRDQVLTHLFSSCCLALQLLNLPTSTQAASPSQKMDVANEREVAANNGCCSYLGLCGSIYHLFPLHFSQQLQVVYWLWTNTESFPKFNGLSKLWSWCEASNEKLPEQEHCKLLWVNSETSLLPAEKRCEIFSRSSTIEKGSWISCQASVSHNSGSSK